MFLFVFVSLKAEGEVKGELSADVVFITIEKFTVSILVCEVFSSQVVCELMTYNNKNKGVCEFQKCNFQKCKFSNL